MPIKDRRSDAQDHRVIFTIIRTIVSVLIFSTVSATIFAAYKLEVPAFLIHLIDISFGSVASLLMQTHPSTNQQHPAGTVADPLNTDTTIVANETGNKKEQEIANTRAAAIQGQADQDAARLAQDAPKEPNVTN